MTAKEIKELRKKLGWSLQKFANELRVGITTVWRWEAGKAKPSSLALFRIKDLARKHGISIVAIL